MAEPILETRELWRNFGGLTAVQGVSIAFQPGQVHAIIGPNGAGKSTLINLLSGDMPPSSGTIRFQGRDITKARPDQVSQLGIGRSYQKTNIFPSLTVWENCWLGAQSRLPSCMRFFRRAERYADVERRAERALDLCGLRQRRDTRADAMSYGEQRQLEIGMMLATEPRLLLLDEPLAGMGADECRQVVDLMRRLSADHTLILIEHDMDVVFAIADVLTVMVGGRVVASGGVEEVRSDPRVQQAYLGEEAA